ncbi:MAG: hypothetical protein A2Y40_09235 [Candidatus Margulisbacteria bacterium GWF2_35_9]|nr:MAG: hypothetical protein A2Y40_09235 [Candidatus Margulisbacteria bacterium GWF2_35_9]
MSNSFLDKVFDLHRGGKIILASKYPVRTNEELAMVYTPGVAQVVKAIQQDKQKAKDYTIIGHTVGMFTDGTAILGLGNVGPVAGMPVMEGKAMIYQEFAGLNAYPLLLGTTDVDAIVETIKNLAPSFSLIHLEDIAAPNCFAILERLEQLLDIPVFHDDQYGTALIVLAGLMNSLKVLKKEVADMNIVINGAGAAGIAIAKVLNEYGLTNITLCDSKGIVSLTRSDLNIYKKEILNLIGIERPLGTLSDALDQADIFIGVSVGGALNPTMIQNMNNQPIIFALANPVPEILPTELKDFDGIIATGRSDFPNQINNAVGYPGFVKAVLSSGIKKIGIHHIIKAATAIAETITEQELTRDYIIPNVFNANVVPNIVKSLAK